jgi:hypothetical protein
MEQQFSPGLLYSVAPENFSELHLQDEANTDGFEWEADKSALAQLAQRAVNFIKGSACR